MPAAVALGNFDGVHLGHVYLLQYTRSIAKSKNLEPMAFTFAPHPHRYYGHDVPMICTHDQKTIIMEQAGVKIFLAAFDDKFAALDPEMFMSEYITRHLNAKAVIVGDDFRFGANRAGDVNTLRNYCEANGIECHILPKLALGDTPISSTLIRGLVAKGDMAEVLKYLGRYYSCIGKVVQGDGKGTKIGFPTANLSLFSELLPPDGAYAGFLYIDGQQYKAMVYTGMRPTIDSARERRFEVHILDLEHKSLYGLVLEVYIVQKIRGCVKFNSIDELKKQLEKDRRVIISI
jgi:riboflavin kinase/FMN adenylyltransferase